MTSFYLKILASDHMFFSGRCEALVVPAEDGEVGILPHHESMILATREGELRFRPVGEKSWHKAIIGRGIVQIVNNRIIVLADTAEKPEDIDKARAKEALARAEEQLRQKQSLREFKLSQASMARALIRLKGSHLSER